MTSEELNQISSLVVKASSLVNRISYFKEQIAWCESHKDIAINGNGFMGYLKEEVKVEIRNILAKHYRSQLEITEKQFAELKI